MYLLKCDVFLDWSELFLNVLILCRYWLSVVDAYLLNCCVGRHRCTLCDYTVDRQHILDYHVKNVHACGITAPPGVRSLDDQKTAVDHSDEDVTVVDARQFQKDVASCSTDSPPPMKRRRMQGADVDPVMAAYRCIICGYSGHSVGAVARHHLCHSRWSLPYRCQQCSYRATTRRLLTKHIMTHDRQSTGDDVRSLADQQQHACSYCPYKSSSASHVVAHERFHGAQRRYRCPYCSYSLNRRRLLIQHRRLHATDCRTGAPLRCPIVLCPFTCHDREELTTHGRQHVATVRHRLHACDRCSFAVDSRNALLHHHRLHDQRQ